MLRLSTHWARATWACLLALLLSACAGTILEDALPPDDENSPQEEQPIKRPMSDCPEGLTVNSEVLCGIPSLGEPPEGALVVPDSPFEEPGLDTEAVDAQERAYLVQEGDGRLQVYVGERIQVGVRAINSVGAPVADQEVYFEIREYPDAPPSGAFLLSNVDLTNTFGVAQVTLSAGPNPSFFEITMWLTADEKGFSYQVNVVQPPKDLELNDPIQPGEPVEPVEPGGPEEPVEPVDPGNPGGPLGECLSPEGTYDVTNLYELGRFLGEGTFNTLQTINRALSDPGDLVGEWIEDRIDGIWGSLIRSVITPAVNYVFRYVTDNYAPEWVQWMLILTQDITEVLTRLEIRGALTLSKVDPECGLVGVHEWTDLVFLWRAGCQPNNPQCGRYEISFAQLGAGVSRAEFVGQLSRGLGPTGTLQISEHEMSLNIGVAAVWFIQNVILPARFEVNSFGELLELVIPCRLIGDLVADYLGGTVFGFAVAPFVESACNSGMRGLGNYLTGLLSSSLQVNAFQMAGQCTLRDNDGDKHTDVIEDGRWTQGLQGDFTGPRRR